MIYYQYLHISFRFYLSPVENQVKLLVKPLVDQVKKQQYWYFCITVHFFLILAQFVRFGYLASKKFPGRQNFLTSFQLWVLKTFFPFPSNKYHISIVSVSVKKLSFVKILCRNFEYREKPCPIIKLIREGLFKLYYYFSIM